MLGLKIFVCIVLRILLNGGVAMGRKKKYEKLAIYSFRCEEPIIELAKERANNDGVDLSDVLNNFLSAYVQPNTAITALENEIVERERKVKSELIQIEALRQRLKQKTGDIPTQYIEFYKKRSSKWSDEARAKFIDATARKLKLDSEWLKAKLEEIARSGK